MLKSGLIMFIPALVGTLIGGLVFCCCGPLWAVVAGVAAGYLAGLFGKPAEAGSAAGKGAAAAGIAGVGALIGQIVASFLNNAIMQQNPEAAAELYKLIGIQNFTPEMLGTATGIIGTLIGGGCWGIVDLVLIAAFGALGGYLWFRFSSRKSVENPPQILGSSG
jgi:hypothetical protein